MFICMEQSQSLLPHINNPKTYHTNHSHNQESQKSNHNTVDNSIYSTFPKDFGGLMAGCFDLVFCVKI